jgi:N-acetylglucosamine-6-phosphate deacetylase
MKATVFTGADLVTPREVCRADLVIEGCKIKAVREPGPPRPGEEALDCSGLTIGPGFVDMHVHGGAGHDFVSDDPSEIAAGADYHLSQGATSVVPSALSIPFDELDRAIMAARQAVKLTKAEILGYHVEGIYLDKTYRGGHLDCYVHDPRPEEYIPLLEKHADFITEWTMAPERPGALDLIAKCRAAGILVSAGHTQATAEQMDAAIRAGLSHVTHLYCVMSGIRNSPLRESPGKGYAPGVIEIALVRDDLTAEIIADGFHLHPALIQLAFKCKGPDRLCLVSDSMKGVGLPDGEYLIGGQNCLVEGGIAIIKDRPEIIASSVTPLIGMIRFVVREAGISLTDAWTMASLTPARILGVDDRKGSLEPGKDADLLVLNDDLDVKAVYARGEAVVPLSP